MAYFSTGFAWTLKAKHVEKNYETLSEAALKSAIAIPWELHEILQFSKIPWGAW